jgi:hypothetical protein
VHRAHGPWEEALVTRNAAPKLGSRVAELFYAGASPEVQRVPAAGSRLMADVSSAVGGNGEFNFYVLNDSDSFGIRFSSREGEHPPVLIVTYEYTNEPPIPLPTP